MASYGSTRRAVLIPSARKRGSANVAGPWSLMPAIRPLAVAVPPAPGGATGPSARRSRTARPVSTRARGRSCRGRGGRSRTRTRLRATGPSACWARMRTAARATWRRRKRSRDAGVRRRRMRETPPAGIVKSTGRMRTRRPATWRTTTRQVSRGLRGQITATRPRRNRPLTSTRTVTRSGPTIRGVPGLTWGGAAGSPAGTDTAGTAGTWGSPVAGVAGIPRVAGIRGVARIPRIGGVARIGGIARVAGIAGVTHRRALGRRRRGCPASGVSRGRRERQGETGGGQAGGAATPTSLPGPHTTHDRSGKTVQSRVVNARVALVRWAGASGRGAGALR